MSARLLGFFNQKEKRNYAHSAVFIKAYVLLVSKVEGVEWTWNYCPSYVDQRSDVNSHWPTCGKGQPGSFLGLLGLIFYICDCTFVNNIIVQIYI